MAERTAYVIGEVALYDRLLQTGQRVLKYGRDAHFHGSLLWETRHEAENAVDWLNAVLGRVEFGVYGVLVDWDYVVTPSLAWSGYELLRDCPVVPLSELPT